MDYGPYSPFKAAHVSNADRLQALRIKQTAAPAQVHLVVTNRCNHNCSFCAYRSLHSQSSQTFQVADEIPWEERGRALLDELKESGTSAIQFTGGGEPTVHPRFQNYLNHAQSLGMSTALVTNGTNLNKVDIQSVLRLSWLRISLDSAKAETHAGIRGLPTSAFGKVLNNVSAVVGARNTEGGKLLVGLGFVVTPENHTEIFEGVRIAADLGVDNIRISAAFFDNSLEKHRAYYSDVQEMLKEADNAYGKKVKIFDMFGDRVEDLAQTRPEYSTCWISRLVPYIGADQGLYTCCVLAYNKQGLLGSLKTQRFDTLWTTAAQKHLLNLDARTCAYCMFHGKNRMLKYMLDEDSQHVSFI